MARKGTFKVSNLFLAANGTLLDEEILRMTVLKREASIIRNEIRYLVICDHFDDIPEGCDVPEYQVSSDGYEISFKRVG